MGDIPATWSFINMHLKPKTLAPDRFTNVGKWAFLVSLLFVFSISVDYRMNFAGLLVHPFLIMLPVAIFATGFRLFKISPRVLAPLIIFLVVFSVASIQNEKPSQEILKVSASVLTFLFFATALRTQRDFRMISLGIISVAIAIGYLAFTIGPEQQLGSRLEGINALEGLGNKNAQSLFTLPGLFLSILLLVWSLRKKNVILTAALLAGIFFIVISIFLSANRSGWVGLGIIVAIYFMYFRLSLNLMFVVTVLFFFSYLGIDKYASDIVERKRMQTVEGYESDEGRLILIKESLKVGYENPLLGIGMDQLHKRMNVVVHRSSLEFGETDTHFLFGYLFGATGIFSLFFFLFFLMRVAERKKRLGLKKAEEDPWILLVGFVVLFIVRSFFTREILYSPTFVGTLGLLYGYYAMHIRNARVTQ